MIMRIHFHYSELESRLRTPSNSIKARCNIFRPVEHVSSEKQKTLIQLLAFYHEFIGPFRSLQFAVGCTLGGKMSEKSWMSRGADVFLRLWGTRGWEDFWMKPFFGESRSLGLSLFEKNDLFDGWERECGGYSEFGQKSKTSARLVTVYCRVPVVVGGGLFILFPASRKLTISRRIWTGPKGSIKGDDAGKWIFPVIARKTPGMNDGTEPRRNE